MQTELFRVKPSDLGGVIGVLSLRHDAFVAEGEIAPMPNGQFADEFDELPNALNFALLSRPAWQAVAAIRLHVLRDPYDWSPAYEAFTHELGCLLACKAKVLDCNRLVTSPETRGFNKLDLYNKITRCAFMAMEAFGIDSVTMTVRKEHRSFYARELMAEELAPLRAYPMLKSPICLMVTDVAKNLGTILDKNPRWRSTEAERAEMFKC